MFADVILTHGRFATLDRRNLNPQAVAIAGGLFLAVGTEEEVRAHAGPATKFIDLKGCPSMSISTPPEVRWTPANGPRRSYPHRCQCASSET